MVKIKTIVEVLGYRHALVMPTKSEAPREVQFPRGFCAQHHVRRWRALGNASRDDANACKARKNENDATGERYPLTHDREVNADGSPADRE